MFCSLDKRVSSEVTCPDASSVPFSPMPSAASVVLPNAASHTNYSQMGKQTFNDKRLRALATPSRTSLREPFRRVLVDAGESSQPRACAAAPDRRCSLDVCEKRELADAVKSASVEAVCDDECIVRRRQNRVSFENAPGYTSEGSDSKPTPPATAGACRAHRLGPPDLIVPSRVEYASVMDDIVDTSSVRIRNDQRHSPPNTPVDVDDDSSGNNETGRGLEIQYDRRHRQHRRRARPMEVINTDGPKTVEAADDQQI